MISDSTTLQAAVESWLDRTDLDLPGLIQLAERRIARLVRRKTVRASLPLAAYATDLTQLADFGELRSIRIDSAYIGQNHPIKIVTPEQLAEMRQLFASTGRPQYACVVGTELLCGPTPDETYTTEVTYFEKLVPLATAADGVNSLITEAPDLYLWGVMVEASKFLEHDARVPMWKDSFESAIVELNEVREREEFSASLRPIRLPVVFG